MRPWNTHSRWLFGLLLMIFGWYVQSWWGAIGLLPLIATIEDDRQMVPLRAYHHEQRKREY